MLRDGTYNGYVRENLPPQYRVGTIRRKDYWDVWTDERANFFEGTSSEDVAAFIRLASAQPKERSAFTPRLASMTAGDFFRFCALGYAANNYPVDDLSPREQYLRFADGRDEGLTDIDERSPEAFYAWLTARHGGGHPWAVCTHISLGVACDSGGYWLRLTEKIESWTIETVRFYLALCRAGVQLKHDQTLKIKDLPSGAYYSVTEDPGDNYTSNPSNATTGTIPKPTDEGGGEYKAGVAEVN